MIENLEFNEDGIGEGTFLSSFFANEQDDRLWIYIQNKELSDYAEKCIEHFNSMNDDMIDIICKGIAESAKQDDFEEEIENIRDILEYCWFTSLIVGTPKSNEIEYMVEGEGEWGDCIGFIIRGDNVLYVGNDIYSEEI